MSLDDIAVFLILVVLWIGIRFLSIRWLWRAVARGTISNRVGQVLHASLLAVLPLLALPWALWAWPLLIGAGVVLFLTQLALSGAYREFLRRNP